MRSLSGGREWQLDNNDFVPARRALQVLKFSYRSRLPQQGAHDRNKTLEIAVSQLRVLTLLGLAMTTVD